MNRQHPVAVFFDVGGTLLARSDDLVEVVFTQLFAARRVRSKDAVAAAVERSRQRGARPGEGAADPEDPAVRHAIHLDIFRELALEPLAEALALNLEERLGFGPALVLAPGAIAAVELARNSGARLGVISNWDETLESTLERAGLLSYLPAVVSSWRVGAQKPERAIFEAALLEVGVEPASAWYVGDDPLEDVAGARRAGMRAALVERPGRPAPSGHGAEVVAGRVDEAVKLLLEARARSA